MINTIVFRVNGWTFINVFLTKNLWSQRVTGPSLGPEMDQLVLVRPDHVTLDHNQKTINCCKTIVCNEITTRHESLIRHFIPLNEVKLCRQNGSLCTENFSPHKRTHNLMCWHRLLTSLRYYQKPDKFLQYDILKT